MSGESLEGDDIEKDITLNRAYSLGSLVQYLTQAAEQEWFIGKVEPSDSGRGHILYGLVTLRGRIRNLSFSDSTDEAITGQVNHLNARYTGEDRIERKDAKMLSQDVSTWGQQIRTYLGRQSVIVVSNTGLFDVDRAMENPHELFEPEVWKWMSNRAKNDVRQACRALAVEAPTASVRVSLRAVEDVLRDWYEYDTGNEIERGKWGSVLSKLIDEHDRMDQVF